MRLQTFVYYIFFATYTNGQLEKFFQNEMQYQNQYTDNGITFQPLPDDKRNRRSRKAFERLQANNEIKKDQPIKKIEDATTLGENTVEPSENKELLDFLERKPSSSTFLMKKSQLKKETCKSKRFKQKISHDGCQSKFISNRMCYGSCNSFYVPTQRIQSHDGPFVTCSTCFPYKSIVNKVVKLKCINGGTQIINVEKIRSCQCREVFFPIDQMGQ